MRLLPLEAPVREDLDRCFAGSDKAPAAAAVVGWLAALAEGRPGADQWARCEDRPGQHLEGCLRVDFSPADQVRQGHAPQPAAGPREYRIVVEMIEHDGGPAIRTLAVGPKYAGRGTSRVEWAYDQAHRRRAHPYRKGGNG